MQNGECCTCWLVLEQREERRVKRTRGLVAGRHREFQATGLSSHCPLTTERTQRASDSHLICSSLTRVGSDFEQYPGEALLFSRLASPRLASSPIFTRAFFSLHARRTERGSARSLGLSPRPFLTVFAVSIYPVFK